MLAIIKSPGSEARILHNIFNNRSAIEKELDADRISCEELRNDVYMWYDADGFAKTLPPGITNDYTDYYYYGDVLFTSKFDGLPCSLDERQIRYVHSYISAHRVDRPQKRA